MIEFAPYSRSFLPPTASSAPRMGLRPIATREWLTRSRDHEAYMTAKLGRMDAHPDTVCQTLPDSQAAQTEVLRLVRVHLGLPPHDECAAAAPLAVAARLVEEDLCVMQPRGGGYTLTAASVASPSYWRLADKLGKELLDIHEDVAGLRARIGERMRHFFRELPPERVYLPGNFWGRAWEQYMTSNGELGEEPPAGVRELYALHTNFLQAPIGTQASADALAALYANIRDNHWTFNPIEESYYPTSTHVRIKNTPTGQVEEMGIVIMYGMEEWYIDE